MSSRSTNHSDELEAALLGAMIYAASRENLEVVDRALEIVSQDDFDGPTHRLIFLAIRDLRDRGDIPEPIAVRAHLAKRNKLEDAGGQDYLAYLVDQAPPPSNTSYYAKGVRSLNYERSFERIRHKDGLERAIEWAKTRNRAQEQPLELRDDLEMESLPRPNWLVQRMIPTGGLAVLYGKPGVGKSLLALDLSLSVATGSSWMGRELTRGRTVYVASEGGAGISSRVRAAKEARGHYGQQVGVDFLLRPICMMDSAEVSRLIAAMLSRPQEPVLLILDTLARTMIGGDENLAKDMGVYINAADRIRSETGAAVLIIHHTNKGGDEERGSIALRGAADVMMAVRKKGSGLLLECSKQRDDASFAPVPFRILSHGGSAVIELTPGSFDDSGESLESTSRKERLYQIIVSEPGKSKNYYARTAGGNRQRALRLIQELETEGRISICQSEGGREPVGNHRISAMVPLVPSMENQDRTGSEPLREPPVVPTSGGPIGPQRGTTTVRQRR